jgi:hypothetical protein
MAIISNLIVFTAILMGPFMPGVSVDTYGKMVMDANKTRAIVMTVIPQTTIESTTRCNAVLFQIDLITKAINEYNAIYVTNGKEVIRLYTTYSSKPEDFQRVLAQMDSEREAGQMKIMDALKEIRAIMTPEEWNAVMTQRDKPS